MARPRLGNAPLTPAERQRRRRELLAAKRDAERSHETTGNRDAAELERLNAEVERLTAELAKRDNAHSHETKGALPYITAAQQQGRPKKPKKLAAPRREDQIKICGVSFWPQTENQPKAPYHVVWGAAHIADEVYREFHLACKMPIADAIMAAKQLCRALRLFNKEGGQLTLAMLTAMANQKELLKDHTATSWPTLSGKPPAFDA